MDLKIIDGEFSVCKVKDASQIYYDDDFVFVDAKDGELSVICRTRFLPPDCSEYENGYQGLQVKGKTDAFLLGCIAGIVKVFKERDIRVFVVAADTAKYIFVEKQHFPKMIEGLKAAGYPAVE